MRERERREREREREGERERGREKEGEGERGGGSRVVINIPLGTSSPDCLMTFNCLIVSKM